MTNLVLFSSQDFQKYSFFSVLKGVARLFVHHTENIYLIKVLNETVSKLHLQVILSVVCNRDAWHYVLFFAG